MKKIKGKQLNCLESADYCDLAVKCHFKRIDNCCGPGKGH